MRNKKLVILLLICIAVVMAVLVCRGIAGKGSNPRESVVTTGQAARAVALLTASPEECEAAADHFTKNEEWYVPYMNLLYEKGYFTEKQTVPSAKEATSAFTYKKLGNLYENMGITDKELLSYVKNNKSAKAITNSRWAEILEKMAGFLGDRQRKRSLMWWRQCQMWLPWIPGA